MRSIVVGVLVSGLLIFGAPAQADHAPNGWCSESGDVCASTRRVDGRRMLRIATAANYFDTYTVCVTAPNGSRSCENGRMRDGNDDGIWTGRMAWAKHFPHQGKGAYSVKWRSGSFRSARLGFHVN